MRNTRSSLAVILGLGSILTLGTVIGPANAATTYVERASSGQLMGSDYWDQPIYGLKDEKIGEVNDFVVDPNTGTISALVVGVGGFLGIGEKNVAVPFADVKMTTRGSRSWLTIEATKDALKAAPAFIKPPVNVKPINDTAAKPLADPAKPLPAIKPSSDATQTAVPADATAPVAGANSFTEAQARSRIEAMGYSGVGALVKDAQGVWRGPAMKDGKQVTVAVDFKGNVVMQ